ncbi:MAG: DNA polymerase I, partial [Clostridiales Family XIII bacterium]|nr:DNA polymerase I [Clostridiales Family XIII bacterium]
MDNRTIVIIDGNSLVNRAFFAIQRPMITKDGVYTQAIFGFMNMFEKIMKDYSPAYMAVAFDRKAPTFRHIEYKEYKAGRRKTPAELLMQLPLIKEILDALKVKMLEIDGFEADDIIGTVARSAEAEGLEPLIVTGDKDALQLATEKTRILLTRKGVSEFEMYDSLAMMEKYGFTPEAFIDYKGLMGDKSDNIPGVPGFGEKTAQRLIQEFGSVENLLANLDKVSKEKERAKLEEYAGQARMSRMLATINTAVPIDLDFSTYKVVEADTEKLTDIYLRLEFHSFLKRRWKGPGMGGSGGPEGPEGQGGADAAAGGKGGAEAPGGALGGTGAGAVGGGLAGAGVPGDAAPGAHAAKGGYAKRRRGVRTRTVEGDAGMQALEEAAALADYAVVKVFSDHSHVSAPQAYGVSVLLNDECFYLDLDRIKADGARDGAVPDGGALRRLASVFGGLKKGLAGHGLQADIYAAAPLGFMDGAKICFDTAVGQYLLEPTRKDYGIGGLVFEYFHEAFEEAPEALGAGRQIGMLQMDTDYAASGAAYCAAVDALAPEIRGRLEDEGLTGLLEGAELPLIAALSRMEAAGFAVDKEELSRVGAGLSESISGLSERIYALAGKQFNINSPAQLGVVLFEDLGLPPSKKTKTGYATGAEILEKLRGEHEIIGLILEYRMLAKLSGTYVSGLLPLVGDDGKIHAHFQQTVTATGRISCVEPNLQNIPVKQEQGRAIRKAFVPHGEGNVLVGADYSQIELRVLAHLSGDTALSGDFTRGADIHRRTASRVFGLAEEDVTPLQRSRAKAVNFGVIYGMSGFGLSEELGITRKEAERYIEDYFKAHPAVREYMDGQIAACRANGYVT